MKPFALELFPRSKIYFFSSNYFILQSFRASELFRRKRIFIKSWSWTFCRVICSVNDLTKRLDRRRGARDQRPCLTLEPDKIFNGHPDWPLLWNMPSSLARIEEGLISKVHVA